MDIVFLPLSVAAGMCLLSGIGTAVLCDLSACVSPYPQRFMSMGASLEPPKLSPKSLRLDAQPSFVASLADAEAATNAVGVQGCR